MDLTLLVAPSLLFALLQYKSGVHAQEVKLIQEGLEKFLSERNFDEKNLPGWSRLKKNLDLVRAVKPRGISEWLIWTFVAYLSLISAEHCLAALGLKISGIALWNQSGAGAGFMLTIASAFSIYMVVLAGATCFQIWEISQEKKKITEANAEVKEQIELLLSYKMGYHIPAHFREKPAVFFYSPTANPKTRSNSNSTISPSAAARPCSRATSSRINFADWRLYPPPKSACTASNLRALSSVTAENPL